MAIRDFLWSCPVCGVHGGVRPGRGGDRCAECATVFRRRAGSTIEARMADGRVIVRSARDWAARLPAEALPVAPAETGASSSAASPAEPAGRSPPRAAVTDRPARVPDGEEGGEGGGAPRVWRRDRVVARRAVGDRVLRRGSEYLGRMERFGAALAGTATLTDTTLRLDLDSADRWEWALAELTALQASSGTLQVKPRGEPIVSFEFPESSPRLWEESIAAALRARWRALGRGEILEFQPVIVAR